MNSRLEYNERLNLQSICKYLRHGNLPLKLDEGTLFERKKRIYTDIPESLVIFRDRIIATDWTTIGNDTGTRIIVTENLWNDVMNVISDLASLEYELGFLAGLAISSDIMGNDIFKKKSNI